ncbi:MAG TPA: hypothetical protein VIU29_06790, partial [Candidatus Deferrimicrobiaceae bacterium]
AYEKRVLDHIEKYFPAQAKLFGRERLHPLAVRAIDQADVYAMVSEQSACVYADGLLMLGVDFDVDPQLPFAGAILRDEGLAERERAARLYDAVLDYWGKVAGRDGSDYLAALRNFRKVPVAWTRRPEDGDDGEILGRLLGALYPSKHRFLGDGGVREFVRFSAGKALEIGIGTQAGAAVVAALMFLGGSGVLDDPRFDWLLPLLDRKAMQKEDGLGRLHAQESKKFEEWAR